MTMGQRIKELRERKGLTQKQLAELLGYKSKSSVTHIESGRDIPRQMVAELAKLLDTTPGYLMGWEDERNAIIHNMIDQLTDEQVNCVLEYLEKLVDD